MPPSPHKKKKKILSSRWELNPQPNLIIITGIVLLYIVLNKISTNSPSQGT